MTWDFSKQLKVGRAGERLLLKHWPLPVRKHETLKGPDFVDSTGAIIELKTDTYDMAKTENIFAERYSDMDRLSPGGPWQAHAKGVTVFVYLYATNKRWLVFRDLPALLKRLEVLIEGRPGVQIPNRGFVTLGHKVRRADLAGLYTEEALK